MSKRDLVIVVSRGVSLYFFAWAVDNLTYLPDRLFAFFHRLHGESVLAADHYFRNADIMSLSFVLVRATALFGVAIWLWRGGLGVEKYFSPQAESENGGQL